MKKVAILLVLVVTTSAMAEIRLFGRRNVQQQPQQQVYQQQRSYPTQSHTQAVQYGQQRPTYTTQNSGSDSQQLLSLINNYRAENGLSALAYNPSLNMADGYGLSGHRRFNRSGMSGYANVASTTNAHQTFNMWKNSPGHNANMLAPNATRAGIGYNHNGTTFTAQ